MDTKVFDLVTLTLLFDLLIESFIFWLVDTRAFIFHMSALCDKIFTWIPKIDLMTLTLVFDLLKNFNLGYNFWLVGTRAFAFHMSAPLKKTFS
jgi:hypothetical protein